MTRLLRSPNFWLPNRALLVVMSFMVAGGVVSAQAPRKPAGPVEEEPVFHEYRGVKLGWLADDVRKKLGNPAAKSDEQDYYLFNNETERAQIRSEEHTSELQSR